jgi:hypothetical protein
VGGVLGRVEGIQQVATQAENATVVCLVDLVDFPIEWRFGFHRRFHAGLICYYEPGFGKLRQKTALDPSPALH